MKTVDIDEGDLTVILLKLHDAMPQASKTSSVCTGEISIAVVKPMNAWERREEKDNKNVLDYLRQEGVILDYHLGTGEENVLFTDYAHMSKEEPRRKTFTIKVKTAKCRFYPKKVISYAKKIFEPKKVYLEKLDGLFSRLGKIAEFALREPANIDSKLNDLYVELCKKIESCVAGPQVPLSEKFLYEWQPFSNLFSSKEEMRQKGMDQDRVIANLGYCRGEIKKYIALYAMKERRDNESEIKNSVDEYLGLPKEKTALKGGDRTIRSIIFVKPEGAGKIFSVVINGDYENAIRADIAKQSWCALWQVAKRANGDHDVDFLDATSNKGTIDYFNSNSRCRLYTRTGYKLTKILKIEDGYIEPAIEMSVIGQKAFQQRRNAMRGKKIA